jgi:hypothetical protein
MSTKVATYDVFLSYSLPEARSADLVQRALEEGGLDVFNLASAQAGENIEDLLWQALAESAALVVITPPEGAPASQVVFEVGAFTAWHKPIYVVHSGGGTVRLPSYLAEFPVFPLSRIDDVVQSIKRTIEQSFSQFSDDQRKALVETYQELGTPLDRLLADPALIERVARAFHKRCGTHYSGERLVQELLRVRKRGDLPRRRG